MYIPSSGGFSDQMSLSQMLHIVCHKLVYLLHDLVVASQTDHVWLSV